MLKGTLFLTRITVFLRSLLLHAISLPRLVAYFKLSVTVFHLLLTFYFIFLGVDVR